MKKKTQYNLWSETHNEDAKTLMQGAGMCGCLLAQALDNFKSNTYLYSLTSRGYFIHLVHEISIFVMSRIDRKGISRIHIISDGNATSNVPNFEQFLKQTF